MNPSERWAKSTLPSLQIVIINNTTKTVGEKHREDGRGPFSLAPPDPCIRSCTYLYTRVWQRETRGPYEKFPETQTAKRTQQTPLRTTPKTGVEYQEFYTCNLISINKHYF